MVLEYSIVNILKVLSSKRLFITHVPVITHFVDLFKIITAFKRWLQAEGYFGRRHIDASELKDPICHSNECQIESFRSEASISRCWCLTTPTPQQIRDIAPMICCCNAGPQSATLAQHYTKIG